MKHGITNTAAQPTIAAELVGFAAFVILLPDAKPAINNDLSDPLEHLNQRGKQTFNVRLQTITNLENLLKTQGIRRKRY
jgi:hypothetical protein